MTTDPGTSESVPTSELLSRLLRLLEAEPRRAPDDVVELLRREVERLAPGTERTYEREPKGTSRRRQT